MFDPESFEILLGQHVVDAMRKEQLETCRPGRYPGTFASADVCALQSSQYARGIRGLEAVKAGGWTGQPEFWTLRADSGLERDSVAASPSMGNVDGTFESAMEWAKRWVAEDPDRRYVWRRR